VLNTKLCTNYEAVEGLKAYINEAPSKFNCIITGANGSGKSFAVTKTFKGIKKSLSVIDINFTEELSKIEAEGVELEQAICLLNHSFTGYLSGVLKALEDKFEDEFKAGLRTKLIAKAKEFFEMVDQGENDSYVDPDYARSMANFKGKIVVNVNNFIKDYKRVIRMKNWNLKQLTQILENIEISDAYSIVATFYAQAVEEDSYEKTLGVSYSRITLDFISSLSDWLFKAGQSPIILVLRDTEHFYKVKIMGIFFDNFLRELQAREGNFYTVIEMNGIMSSAFEIIVKNPANINLDISPMSLKEMQSFLLIRDIDSMLPEVIELLELTGGSIELVDKIVSMLGEKQPHEVKQWLKDFHTTNVKSRLSLLTMLYEERVKHPWYVRLLGIDQPVKRAVAHALMNVLNEPSQSLHFAHSFYSRNKLIQRLSFLAILRYRWADQQLLLENPCFAPVLREDELMSLTKSRYDRLKNLIAFRSTWSSQ